MGANQSKTDQTQWNTSKAESYTAVANMSLRHTSLPKLIESHIPTQQKISENDLSDIVCRLDNLKTKSREFYWTVLRAIHYDEDGQQAIHGPLIYRQLKINKEGQVIRPTEPLLLLNESNAPNDLFLRLLANRDTPFSGDSKIGTIKLGPFFTTTPVNACI